jgi:pimeloyl-ACP methyl ester carboxylesterase
MTTPLTIDADDDGELSAELTQASTDALEGSKGRPCVVMAHGLGATRDCGLNGFTDVLSAVGAHVLAFDYRHFGESSGEPRQLASLRGQVRDYHAVVRYARTIPGVDPERIIVWGVSLSGGHVLQVAAQDSRIAGVMSLTPAVDGLAGAAYMLKARGVRNIAKLVRLGIADAVAALLRKPPVLAPLAGRPGDAAAMTSPGALEGMLAIAGPMWRNEFAARLTLQVGTYRPAAGATRVTCPVLMQIADCDQVAPPIAATRVANRLNATTHHYACDHFDVYTGAEFHQPIATHQAQFLRRIAAIQPHPQRKDRR